MPIKGQAPLPRAGGGEPPERVRRTKGLRVLFKVYHKFFLKVKMSRSRFEFEIFKKLRKNLIF